MASILTFMLLTVGLMCHEETFLWKQNKLHVQVYVSDERRMIDVNEKKKSTLQIINRMQRG